MSKARHSITTPSTRFLYAAAFIMPSIALTMGAFLNAGGPSSAEASTPSEQTPVAALPRIGERIAPEDLVARTVWLREQPEMPNPLYYPPRFEPVVERVQTEGEAPRPIDVSAPAPFVVSAMLRGRDGSARAVIDGMLFDAGDELAPGWVIIEINPTRRFVSLRKPDGTTLLLPMQTSQN